MKTRNTTKIRILIALHFLLTVALFVLFQRSYFMIWFESENVSRFYVLLYLMYALLYYLLGRIYRIYDLQYSRILDLVFTQSLSDLIAAVIFYAVYLVAFYMQRYSPLPLLLLLLCQFVLNLLWSILTHRIVHGSAQIQSTAIICRDAADIDSLNELDDHKDIFRIDGVFESPKDTEELLKILDSFNTIFVVGIEETLRNEIAKFCVNTGKTGFFAPHIGDIIISGGEHVQAFTTPLFRVGRAEPNLGYSLIKRIFDIFLSALMLIVLSPFMLITAVLILLYDGAPVFYKQVRLTKDGKQFRIIKFRSMKKDAEKDGVARLSTVNDDRITPIGKFIRACRLDELPQLWNILVGDMTFVGPRPERPEIAEQYERDLPAFRLRLQVKAGLTGYAQVYGKYNSEPYEKLRMDLIYINRMNVIEDIKLIFATVRVLFLRKSTEGVKEGNTTAKK